MKIINDGLPLPVYQAIVNSPYSGTGEKKYASATDLLKPAFQRQLYKDHDKEIEIPASSMVDAMLGTAVHGAIDLANKDTAGMISEERLSYEVDGYLITGGVDLYWNDNGIHKVSDYKTASCWSWGKESKMSDWKMQLNLYALMYRHAGFQVDGLSIIAIYKDFSKSRAKNTLNYPPGKVVEIPIDLMEDEEIIAWIRARIQQHKDVLDGKITECPAEERWEKESVFRVLKPGRKTALKKCASQSEAMVFIAMKGDENLLIDEIPGERTRCMDWCFANKWCPSFQAYMNKERDDNEED